MGGRERMLLEVASIVHDIGTYISPSAHNKHSSYLINASEMFGLRKSDKSIVSNVARYHRRSGPSQTHEPYMSLPKSGRVVVSKLAAILRVADALDHSHQQKIRQFSLERSPNAYTLWVDEQIEDVFIERESLQRKGDLFVDVFGLPIYLKQGAPPK